MSPGGWINLALSLGFVLGLLGWCVWKLFSGGAAPDEKHLAHVEPVHDDELKDR